MKKYIKPETKCIEIECEDMIAASPAISNTQAREDACSKRYGDGFDFEDDEYDDNDLWTSYSIE